MQSPPGTADKTPSVSSPAAGTHETTAEVNGARLTAPAGWTVGMEDGSPVLGAPKDADGYSPGHGVFNSGSTLLPNTDDLGATALKVLKGSMPDAKRLPNVEYAGVTFYHLRSEDERTSYDEYGTVIEGSTASVAWRFNPAFADRKHIDELIDQVMPSFEFEG